MRTDRDDAVPQRRRPEERRGAAENGVTTMLCEECHKEPATVYVTRIVNDHKTEQYLCNRCAREKGEIAGSMEPGFAFHNILAGLFDPDAGLVTGAPRRVAARCPGCGLSLADFRRLGKLGCSRCYAEFERELEPLLKRIHRSVEHTGKRPLAARDARHDLRREVERLRARLAEAVAAEAYEEAARLRDEIRRLEPRLGEA